MAINKNLILMLVTILVSTIGQILLKLGVIKVGGIGGSGSFFKEILKIVSSPILVSGFLAYALASYLTLIALSKIDLSIFSLFTSLGYVLVLIASYFLFKETLTLYKCIGCVLIVVGTYFVSQK